MENSSPTAVFSETPADSSSIIEAFRWMLLARTFEDKMGALYRAGKVVGGVYLGRGQEAFSVALGMHLDRSLGDVYSGLIRDQAGKSAFGESLLDAARTYLGSAAGPMRGRDGNIHRGRPREGMPAMISHLGSSISVINGYLIAKRAKGESGFVGAATAGDGATSTGAFHEALNQAAVEKLPLVVAVADNQFAYSTPTSRQYACDSLVDRASGYGVRGVEVDGTDLGDCLTAFRDAIDRARSGEGPQLIVGNLLRLSGHGEHDDASYVPDSVKAGKFGRDCLEVAYEHIIQNELLSEQQLSDLEKEVQQEVDEAVSQAQSEDPPSPVSDDWRAISTTVLIEGER